MKCFFCNNKDLENMGLIFPNPASKEKMTKIIEIKCCKECPNCVNGTFHDFCKILPYFNDNGEVNHISFEHLDKIPKNCPLKDKE